MATLIGTTVHTRNADYSFASREQAEAFFLQVHNGLHREAPAAHTSARKESLPNTDRRTSKPRH